MPSIRLNLGVVRVRVEWDGRRNVNRPARVISYQGGYIVGFPGDWDALDENKQSIAQGLPTRKAAQKVLRDR
jgi:hypothetical protein